ncbi:Bud-site selection protein [Stachybotrys elegans]|uniref:Bud-site selection protein n=1 Tax=Stachybotrys elegans TaxID=80388 RepID=A0A8K0SS93_9HYPO|nr:Bud-site selection protein [Stachybotrys elegans]
MPKRKRSEPNVPEILETCRVAIYQALKEAKGYERQRLNKRVRDDRAGADKQERLQREISVLKSLDLHQTARAHLYSSLLRVKSIAASTALPDEVRAGVPKPELSEQERAALHNVTTSLYNRAQVKQVVDRALATVCDALDLPVPEKGKRGKKGRDEETNKQPTGSQNNTSKNEKSEPAESDNEWGDESDFQGFESDVDEPGSVVGDAELGDVDAEEAEFSKMDQLLGSSSDEEDEFDEEMLERYRGKETVNLDDISVSGSGAESDEESEEELESEEDSDLSAPKLSLLTDSKSKKAPKEKKRRASPPPIQTGNSTFLPSLMTGYISGSESASDVDVAPPKKRRGQRQRQAIWEQKYGAKAKHLQKEAKRGGGRDQGWDMRRGAVDPEDAGKRTPWKKGIRDPLGAHSRDTQQETARPAPPKRKKDDEGPLHPSWEAKKRAKAAQKTASFAGQKIVFD